MGQILQLVFPVSPQNLSRATIVSVRSTMVRMGLYVYVSTDVKNAFISTLVTTSPTNTAPLPLHILLNSWSSPEQVLRVR